MKKLLTLIALIAALAVPTAAQASGITGTTQYANGTFAAGTSVYLENRSAATGWAWQIRCQVQSDQWAIYQFSAGWGYSPCGVREGDTVRIETAKYLFPSGIVCRGWSNPIFGWSSTNSNYAANVRFSNC